MTPKAIEAALRGILRELQRAGDISPQINVSALSADSTLAEAGLDSVARVSFAALLEEQLNICLDDDEVSDNTTLVAMVSRIARATTLS